MDNLSRIREVTLLEEELLTDFDRVLEEEISKSNIIHDAQFKGIYLAETINLGNNNFTGEEERISLLERVRSNIVRSLYSSQNIIEMQAYMLAYIHYVKKILRQKHQEIIVALLQELDKGNRIEEQEVNYIVSMLSNGFKSMQFNLGVSEAAALYVDVLRNLEKNHLLEGDQLSKLGYALKCHWWKEKNKSSK